MPTEVRDVNVDADGNAIDWRHNERAGIIGTLMLLDRIARHDTNPDFRREARVQCDFLRALVRRRSRDGRDTLDGALREALQALMGPQAALPPGQQPLVIEMDREA